MLAFTVFGAIIILILIIVLAKLSNSSLKKLMEEDQNKSRNLKENESSTRAKTLQTIVKDIEFGAK
jgi:hypothetical protein